MKIELYHYDHGVEYRVVIKVQNNIFIKGQRFKSDVKVYKDYLFYKEYCPDIEYEDNSTQTKELEEFLKIQNKEIKKAKNQNKKPKWRSEGFSVSLKKGRVKTSVSELKWVAARLENLLPIFAFKHITTNL